MPPDQVDLLFGSDEVIVANMTFDGDNCVGPTNFQFTLSLMRGPNSQEVDETFMPLVVNSFSHSYPDCPNGKENIRANLGSWRPYRFYKLVVIPSTNISSADPTEKIFSTEPASKN